MKELNIGDIVIHKVSGQHMVLIGDIEKASRNKCRFLNPVSGKYEIDEFFLYELQIIEQVNSSYVKNSKTPLVDKDNLI